jgi:branched-subunit amino acid transport protein
MDATLTWLTILLMALAAYSNRALFILLAGRIELPSSVRRALRYVPPAVLSALIVSALLLNTGTLDLTPGNERIWAGAVAWLVAWRSRNVLLTIVCGMAALHIVRYALAAL